MISICQVKIDDVKGLPSGDGRHQHNGITLFDCDLLIGTPSVDQRDMRVSRYGERCMDSRKSGSWWDGHRKLAQTAGGILF